MKIFKEDNEDCSSSSEYIIKLNRKEFLALRQLVESGKDDFYMSIPEHKEIIQKLED